MDRREFVKMLGAGGLLVGLGALVGTGCAEEPPPDEPMIDPAGPPPEPEDMPPPEGEAPPAEGTPPDEAEAPPAEADEPTEGD